MDISPSELIADLDDALAEAGTSVILTRFYGTQRTPVSVECKVILRGYRATENMMVAGDIQQSDQSFIMSPTEINQANWPGFHNNEPENIDLRVPRKNDQIIAPRGKMTVQEASPIYVQEILVRIEGRVKGN